MVKAKAMPRKPEGPQAAGNTPVAELPQLLDREEVVDEAPLQAMAYDSCQAKANLPTMRSLMGMEDAQ